MCNGLDHCPGVVALRLTCAAADTLFNIKAKFDSHGVHEDMVFPRGAEPKVLGTVIWAQPASPFA